MASLIKNEKIMKYTTEEKVAFLKTLIEEYYTQGDSYYASQTKTGKWRFGYTNDCEMQHGSGEEMMLPDLIVENLMDKTNVKFAIPVVVRQSEQLCGKPNCNRVKLQNSPLCSYHWDIANS